MVACRDLAQGPELVGVKGARCFRLAISCGNWRWSTAIFVSNSFRHGRHGDHLLSEPRSIGVESHVSHVVPRPMVMSPGARNVGLCVPRLHHVTRADKRNGDYGGVRHVAASRATPVFPSAGREPRFASIGSPSGKMPTALFASNSATALDGAYVPRFLGGFRFARGHEPLPRPDKVPVLGSSVPSAAWP
ncbi:MAG: hypothetical protein CM15mP128_4060 [Methanobacteriota archaeon]|nr:MAG: hypothetical protein CM15mP128_4060 [Euryarchaeota archaeon]